MPRTELKILDSLVEKFGPTEVAPSRFFVSWNSVVTLAYSGFSASLLEMKSMIQQRIPELKPENPGSRWPKTTLGCLMDGERLSPSEADELRSICAEHSKGLGGTKIAINSVSLVVFQCRTLEKRLVTHDFLLGGERLADDRPPRWHLKKVAEVMDQFSRERSAGYYPKLDPDGRTLWNYYRKPHVETTLVADLAIPHNVTEAISGFCGAVEARFEGKFGWFDRESRHLTIRALLFE